MDHANAGYERIFGTDDLTVGVGFPLTDASESRPDHEAELRLAGRAEDLGFDALWARDVPLYWPRFGDAGQTFDPWTWLTAAATHTEKIALGTASVVLPLRHPLHVAKSAASVDRLSDGRLVLGVATGDRDPEYPAFDVEADDRGALFRESVELLRTVWREEFPEADGRWGRLDGDLDLVPKPTAGTIPLLPTGNARQSVEWIADNGDGWLFYHLPEGTLESYLDEWREAAGEKPYAMVVRTVLADDPTAAAEPVHQGYRAGSEWFVEYFRTLDSMGVDHVVVSTPGEDPERELTELAEDVFERV
ncbi:LLM class oxidoreductase [Haloarcula nitratireducens]|uniref:LLM class oxidoreductase n=1 Tax=Haloarcula nitratireducens TaxID=2487749 RepID=A0AAW4P854_9EURY|nr:LLM class oxidoreductase [Halomicroarcula nitratireducens]MBX0293921.1 LLM class oxidoreductase [Halomicroarcula nitratireducens]